MKKNTTKADSQIAELIQLEDKGETTDPAGAATDDLTNVNSVQCSTTVPFTNAAVAAVVPKRRLSVIIIE